MNPRLHPLQVKWAGYRKLVAFGLVMISGALLQAFGRLDATFVTLASTMYGLFIGGNVGEHAASRPPRSTDTVSITQITPPVVVGEAPSAGAGLKIQPAGQPAPAAAPLDPAVAEIRRMMASGATFDDLHAALAIEEAAARAAMVP